MAPATVPTPTAARRAGAISERTPPAPVEAGRATVASGGPELLADVVALPHDAAIEQIIAVRTAALLARVGDGVPGLHATLMGQAERGLFRAVLAHTQNHLGRAAKILGLDRNTCARKARAFGLLDQPSRGRKPRADTAARPAAGREARPGRGRAGKKAR